jgi:hypothetical protein
LQVASLGLALGRFHPGLVSIEDDFEERILEADVQVQ